MWPKPITFDAYAAGFANRPGRYRHASGARGSKPWRVIYSFDDALAPTHVELHGSNGNAVIRYATWEAAKARADALNASGTPPQAHPETWGFVMPRAA